MPPVSDELYPRHRRSRTGCLTCRKAKHKCDEQKPVCGRCQRTVRICKYPSPTDGSSYSQMLTISSSDRTSSFGSIPHAESSMNAIERTLEAIPPAITLVDLLALAIPDTKERSLLQHFLCFGTVNLHAIPHPNKPIHCFDVSECFQNRRGSSMEIDSFFLSIISIAAVHRSSMFLQMEKKYIQQPPVGRWGVPPLPSSSDPPNKSQIISLRNTGISSSKAAIELGKIALNLKLSASNTEGDITLATTELKTVADVILTSIVCICISQVMLVSQAWKEAYNLGLQVIKLRGGPPKMLEEAKTMSADSLDRTRTLLENLAIIDVWHCLASGTAPSLLEKEFQPWWFDFSDQITDAEHPDSFQFICGMDRGMLEVVNRINILVYEHGVLSKLPNPAYINIHAQKVQDMLLELNIWEMTIGSANRPARVQIGNLIIAFTMRVVICVDLLGYTHSHPTVQSYASLALTHLETSRKSYTVNMLVPTIIVGSMMYTAEGRNQAKRVIEALRSDVSFSYDVEEALRILEQLYALRDQGNIDPSWRPLMQDILLL
ncbi:uncharacterized protein I206_107136 [Kwoniella pini CBS 10737]|uniref:Zn(2)-C6 fungal-type domain-containing protein n=1 Tax=Kwoniella pini CBS 10737 TaxID=1296096 RepID=A0A1B9HZ79_9TREE|nr:uncharacterized protein I206_05320 [Kwoniella pini CBS 10737]OCF48541.1 hypothetical protein I206_05320 [Kwoniella pini CBS 10737]